jgi:hypothetical protein
MMFSSLCERHRSFWPGRREMASVETESLFR